MGLLADSLSENAHAIICYRGSSMICFILTCVVLNHEIISNYNIISLAFF